MKNSFIIRATISFMGIVALCLPLQAEKLVILHTNDTHSSIDPLADGTSGIIQRKAIIDSVKNIEKNVITVDAGDVVQGTLYFKYFHGDVEYPLMEMSGYDIRILGNHEFDNGMEELAKYYKNISAAKLSANYDFTDTPLEGVFEPYIIKEVEGHKIGFFGLNLDPESIISKQNIDVNFKDVIPVADSIASLLKNEKGCEVVVAVTHIGYEKINEKPTDVELAMASKDIDLIIGGHSHTLVDPENPEKYPSIINNAEGKPVRVVQTGKQGKYMGKVTIDLDKLVENEAQIPAYELIAVTDRFPEERLDKEMIEFLIPYREKVDSVNNHVVALSAYDMVNQRTGGMANMTADFGYQYGNHIADSLRRINPEIPRVDLAMMNVGGIRHPMPAGNITEGQILSTYPFSNKFTIIKLKGSDIIEAMKVSAAKGGEAVSSNVLVVTDNERNLRRVIIDGNEMDPEKYYTLATIDYVAQGNDDLRSLANHELVWEGREEVSVPILQWFKKQTELGLVVNPDPRSRFVVETTIEI